MAQIFRTFISLKELEPGRTVTYDELARSAESFNRSAALEMLALMNLAISSATAEARMQKRVQPVVEVQRSLLLEVVSERRQAQLRSKFGDDFLLDYPLFHRTQLLFAVRIVATHAQATGGNELRTRDELDAVGEFLLLINGALPSPERSASRAVQIAAQMAPLHETENPPDISASWPRVYQLFTHYLPQATSKPAHLKVLESVVVYSSGFNLGAWMDLSYMLWAYWVFVSVQGLVAVRARAYLDPSDKHQAISATELTRVVDALGVRFEDIPQLLKTDRLGDNAPYDLSPFRTKPLWLMPNGQVLCVDPSALMERLGAHAFWGAINNLDTPERRQEFSGIWGRAFESYCLDALAKVFRGKKWEFVRNPTDRSCSEEVWDGLAVRDNVAIVIECKGTFVRSAEKYSGQPRPFFRGLSKRFGRPRPGGLGQIVRGIERVWQRGADTGIPSLAAVTEVFPILIGQDPVLGGPGVCRVLADRFHIALTRSRRRSVNNLRVWPLTTMTADDLDRVTAAVEASNGRLDAFLRGYHRSNNSGMGRLSDFFSARAHNYFGPVEKTNELLAGRFRSHAAAAVTRFREGAYGGISPG
jgi:hypothetical protein